MRLTTIPLLLLMATGASCAFANDTPPRAEGSPRGLLLVADFNDSIQNNLGGYYNKFERAPSSASTFLMSDIRRGHGGQSLRLKTNKHPEGGFAGVWFHLFDFRAEDGPRYFDARGYDYLSFWIKGQKGGEDFTVKLADADWVESEDSLPVGTIRQFIKGKVTTEWKEVLVPIKQFDTLDMSRMAGVTLDFDAAGSATVYIDDIAFKTTPRVATPLARPGHGAVKVHQQYPRAMWIWSTNQLLDDKPAREELFAFCKRENIDQLWLQIIYKFQPDIDVSQVPLLEQLPGDLRCELQHQDAMRRFLGEAHAHGITVHTLDGYPEYAQELYHPMPLAIVDAVIAFNKASPPNQRFDGIHFDNEPYLLSGSRDRERNEQILQQFLSLNAEAQRRVRERSDMVYGIDIPFFWQDKDAKTGRVVGEVTYNGQRKAASYHCIDMLDNVGIMNYRDTADGADGMIAHGQDLLVYGEKAGRAKIYMGIETFSYEPTDCWFVAGLPREVFAAAIEDKGNYLSRLSRVDGFRKQIYDDDENIHVAIELPPKPTHELRKTVMATMSKITRQLGAVSHPQLADLQESIAATAMAAFEADVEWRNPRLRTIIDPQTGDPYPGVIATSIMLPKITFAQESYDEIEAQTNAAEAFFRRHKSYAGVAIHYYLTYKAKVDSRTQ